MVTHTHRTRLKYTPDQLFDLVANVERYSEFIPWMIATRVRRRQLASTRVLIISEVSAMSDASMKHGRMKYPFHFIAGLRVN